MNEIGLGQLIESLRAELHAAEQASQDHDLRFTVNEITVELVLQIKADASVSGGVKFLVFEIGSKISEAETNTHKIKLTLTPKRKDGRALDIHDDTVPDDLL